MSDVTLDSTPDGVEDQLGEDLRLTLLLATQAAQRMVQMFDERSRERARESEDATRRFQAETQAHHAAAIAATAGCDSDRWWQEATPRQLVAAWQAARVWEGREEEMTSRAGLLREGFADRYGVTDPDQLRLVDVMAMRGDTEDKTAQLDSPLAQARWQGDQARAYAEELSAEADRLRTELSDLPLGQRQFVAGEEVAGFDRKDWLESRLGAVEHTATQARDVQAQAEARVERLSATGATQAPAEQKSWDARWDTPERRQALRDRLERANVPADAATARLLTDRAQGMPPSAATWRPPTGTPVSRRPPAVAVRTPTRARTR